MREVDGATSSSAGLAHATRSRGSRFERATADDLEEFRWLRSHDCPVQ
jgi:hypothetical protein